MPMFLEERMAENIDYGSGFASDYSNQIVQTAGGNEYRSQRHPFIMASMTIDFERQTNFVVEEIIDLHNRAGGTLRGFRVKNPVDYSTNNYRGVPTAFDQAMSLISTGVYQLMRWFGDSSDSTCARRRIRKPVAGTVLVGVAGATYPAAQWSVDTTTGLVTMAANKTGTITGISQASSAVVQAVNTLVVGETVHFSSVAGMTQINGLRGTVTARTGTQFTVNINTALFSAYTSGGAFNTRPQSGEAVTAGCQYDLPMRFTADMRGSFSNWNTINAPSISQCHICLTTILELRLQF